MAVAWVLAGRARSRGVGATAVGSGVDDEVRGAVGSGVDDRIREAVGTGCDG
jgi:hypothetical protein